MCIVYILPASQRPNPMGLNLLFKAITTGRVNPKENRDTLIGQTPLPAIYT